MGVNPVLFRSKWSGTGKMNVSVIPNPKVPGVFTARAIVRAEGQVPQGTRELLRQIRDCSDIDSLSVFLESQAALEKPVALDLAAASGYLPAEFTAAFEGRSFPGGLNYFLVQPGKEPDEPVYPVWTRDIKRSLQAIDGKYDEIAPMSFEFVPTMNCIYRCHECAYRQPKERLGLWERNIFTPQFHMRISTARVLLLRLKEADVTEALFTGGGEPILDRATPEAMRFAKKEIGIKKVGLYTDGALITEAKARELIAAGPDYIRVSLNAGTRETHLKHHNPLRTDGKVDYFANTLLAIEYLLRFKLEQQAKTVLGISYLVDPNNVAEIAVSARLIAAIAKRYPGALNYMRYTPSVNYFGPEQHDQGMFERAVDLTQSEATPALTGAGVESTIYRHRFRGLYEKRPYDRCLAAGMYGGVGPDGTLYWCCERLFNPDFAFGSLLDRPLAEIWAGPERKKVADHVGCAVKGGTDSPCPVVCKPHEHNKVFAQIEKLREAGRIDVARAWLEQVHTFITGSQSKADARFYAFEAGPAGPPKTD